MKNQRKKLVPKCQNNNGNAFGKIGSDIRDYHANTNYGYNGVFDEAAYQKLWKEKFAKEHPFWGSGITKGYGGANWAHILPLYERDRDIVKQRAAKARAMQAAQKENEILKEQLAQAKADAEERHYLDSINSEYAKNDAYYSGRMDAINSRDKEDTGLYSDTLRTRDGGARIVNRAVPFHNRQYGDQDAAQVIQVHPDGTRDTSYVSALYPEHAELHYNSNKRWIDEHPDRYTTHGYNALSPEQTAMLFPTQETQRRARRTR